MPTTLKLVNGEGMATLISDPAFAAFFRHIGGKPTVGLADTGNPNDRRTNYSLPTAQNLFFDIIVKWFLHLQNPLAHDIMIDNNNTYTIDTLPITPRNYFGGEYGKISPLGFKDWGSRQIERNSPASDVANLLTLLYNLTVAYNNFKVSFNGHSANHAAYHAADGTVFSHPDIVQPTPNGVVPSLKYNQGYSKYLVELERTNPEFIKPRVGEWFKRIFEMSNAIIPVMNAHLLDTTVHAVADTDNLITIKPVKL